MGTSAGDGAITEGKPQTIKYETGITAYEVNDDIGTLTLEGFPENTALYLSKTNPTDTVIKAENTHYISDGTNVSFSEDSSADTVTNPQSKSCGCYSMQLAKHVPRPNRSVLSDAVTITNFPINRKNDQIDPTDPNVLGMTKHFFLDVEFDDANKNVLWWSEGTGSLEAIGTNRNGDTICYVWVLGEVTAHSSDGSGKYDFTEETTLTTADTPAKGKVNRSLAQEYADAFVKIYELDRTIFGSEATQVYYDGKNTADMDYLSDTGVVVNLLFYDIRHTKEKVTTYGFFYGKDLLPNEVDYQTITGKPYSENDAVCKYSNEGNYLYINSYMSDNTGSVLTTLAHEFQHMIAHNMKLVQTGSDGYSSEFDEMMSVSAEDLTFFALPKIKFSGETAINSYMSEYQESYISNGIEVVPELRSKNLHYGAGFSFISWLARKYGVGVIYCIAQNNKLDWAAVLDGVASQSGQKVTVDELMVSYSTDCIVGMDAGGTFIGTNPLEASDPCYCAAENYGYPLMTIILSGKNDATTTGFDQSSDVWQNKFSEAGDYGFVELSGYELYDYDKYMNLRPYGMMLHKIGTTETGDNATLTFTSQKSASQDEMMYLVAVPPKN